MQRRWGGQSVRVVNRVLLGRVIREGVGGRFPTQKVAAKRLGVHVGHYSRLARGMIGGSIRKRLYSTIRALIPPEMEQDLDRAVLTSEALELRDRYGDWLADQLQLVDLAHVGLAALVPSPEVTGRVLAGPRHQTRRRELRHHGYVDLLAFLRAHRSHGAAVNGFVAWAEGAGYRPDELGHRHPRLELALSRIVSPLLGGFETAGVERTFEDLNSGPDLAKYLRAAIARERILMERAPDLQRLQVAAQGRGARPSARP